MMITLGVLRIVSLGSFNFYGLTYIPDTDWTYIQTTVIGQNIYTNDDTLSVLRIVSLGSFEFPD